MPTSTMPKTADAPLSAEDKRYQKQIERNLAKIKRIQEEMAAEWKAMERLQRPRRSIVEEVKAIL
ncbi:MAG: hypothetical protein QOE70_4507, partial [Chthoniobacter sp.]|nr:hypothetical protein [Chthoniobacter sp.]